MTMDSSDLFFRAILCNWLVCLAVWSAMRAQRDAAKLVMIFWCLFAFIGAGFEHSVANMTLLGIGLAQEHADAISWAGFVHNMVPVTLGNIGGGAIFVGGLYWLANARIAIRPRRRGSGLTGPRPRSGASHQPLPLVGRGAGGEGPYCFTSMTSRGGSWSVVTLKFCSPFRPIAQPSSASKSQCCFASRMVFPGPSTVCWAKVCWPASVC